MITPRHQASAVALDLIKRFEGVRHEAVQLADGRWTIGHGHTLTAREGVSVSDEDAHDLLIYDLRAVAAAIDAAVFTPLSQNQFDALASFVFNIGVDGFLHSAVLRRINEGQLIQAAFALEIWRKADFDGERIVVDALVRRRAAEKALFLTPDGGWIPAPSTLIEPKPDHGLALATPESEERTAADGQDMAGHGWTVDADTPSPVERAAANLAARLEALAPAEPAPSTPADPAADFPGEPAPFPDGAEPAPTSPAAETFDAPIAAAPAASIDAEAVRRTIFGVPEPRPKLALREHAPLLLLGGAGLAIFLGAVIWAFHARPAAGAAVPISLGVVLVGFVGILGVAAAVYLLLEKLADRGA